MSANVSSPANFSKWPFWRVLEFDKFAGEWPLLTNYIKSYSFGSPEALGYSQQLKQFIVVICFDSLSRE